ncbi:MAG: Gx transporter family protein [Clostridia bacterium]|nr:Gx transporter family protein [Clostridia bacterium]
MKKKSQKIALLGVCTAIAMVLAYVEVQLPPLYAAVPGIKLGLPNIAIIFVLYRMGLPEAAAVSFVRILAVSLLFGNPMTFAYSVAGGLLSLAVMTLLKKLDFLSTVGVSVAGGVMHNVGQILMAMLLLGTAELGYYLIVLAVTGTISGIFIGLCGSFAIKRIKFKNV